MSGSSIDFKALCAPFPPEDIEWRIGSCGKKKTGEIWAQVLAYVTNRAIMQRLDDVVGPANWRNEFREWKDKAQLCGISVRIDGEWVTKWDGAQDSEIESVKGGLSDSQKRAGVQWGIGRYLYDLPEGWATISPQGKHYARLKKEDGGESFRWDPPGLPWWAHPGETGKPPAPRQPAGLAEPPPPAAPQPTPPAAPPKLTLAQRMEKIRAADTEEELNKLAALVDQRAKEGAITEQERAVLSGLVATRFMELRGEPL